MFKCKKKEKTKQNMLGKAVLETFWKLIIWKSQNSNEQITAFVTNIASIFFHIIQEQSMRQRRKIKKNKKVRTAANFDFMTLFLMTR